MHNNMEELDYVNTMWNSAEVFASQQQHRWAMDEALLNSRHLTPRRVGRSKLFVPKIQGYHRRKMADFVGQFVGDEPVTVKNTLTSDSLGAKVLQRVHNHYLSQDVNYESLIYNAAYCGLGYNFAPAYIDWHEEIITETETLTIQQPDGSFIQETREQDVIVASYPIIETLSPESVRIDPSVSWDTLDDARYIGFYTYKDEAYCHDMVASGKWPEIDESYFEGNPATNQTNPLRNERRSNYSPFSGNEVMDIDNGLVEIRYHFYFKEDKKEGFMPVRSVTLSDGMILEEAEPLRVNWGGRKHAWPFVVGYVYPKPFEQYAASLPEQAQDMQTEVNAIRNQRRDNVSLILNPEKYVTPHAGISPEQLAFSFPGKVVSVDNLNAIQWQTVPDVTSTGHNEETRADSDMDRLFSEGPMRMGVEGRRKESATAIQTMSANSSAATGLDTMAFVISFVRPLNEKLGNAIAQKAPEALFLAAAKELMLNPNIDPVLIATTGEFKYNVFASASQNELANTLSTNSNIMGLIQTTYGQHANYKPLVDQILELAGFDPDAIIPNPMQQGMVNMAQMDMGGVDPQGTPSIQPRAQFQGGMMPEGSGNQ